MARLTIDVKEREGKTYSSFAAFQGDKIVFHNGHATAKLTVTIEGATDAESPICDADGPVPSFEVPASKSEKFWVCGDLGEFKYTATIFGTTPEDPHVTVKADPCNPSQINPIVIIDWQKCGLSEPNPIVIIDRENAAGSSALLITGAALLGLLAGIVVTNLLRGKGRGG